MVWNEGIPEWLTILHQMIKANFSVQRWIQPPYIPAYSKFHWVPQKHRKIGPIKVNIKKKQEILWKSARLRNRKNKRRLKGKIHTTGFNGVPHPPTPRNSQKPPDWGSYHKQYQVQDRCPKMVFKVSLSNPNKGRHVLTSCFNSQLSPHGCPQGVFRWRWFHFPDPRTEWRNGWRSK